MNVALPSELERRVDERVKRGEFANREEFFTRAAELLLDLDLTGGSPVPAGGHWDQRLASLVEEAQASGEPTEMTERDWDDVEGQALVLMKARKKA